MITKCRPNHNYNSSRASLERFARVLGVMEKAMGQCIAQCKTLLFRARAIVRDLDSTELAHLKKEKHFTRFASSWFGTLVSSWFGTFAMLFLAPLEVLLVMKHLTMNGTLL